MLLKAQVIAALVAPTLLVQAADMSSRTTFSEGAGGYDIDSIVHIDAVRYRAQTILTRAPSSASAPLFLASVAVIED